MIDPIKDMTQADYTVTTARRTDAASTDTPFSLDYEDDGVIYEPRQQQKEAVKPDASRTSPAAASTTFSKGPAATLDLSEEARSHLAPGKEQAAPAATGDLFTRIKNFFVSLFHSIWDDSSKANDASKAEASEKTLDSMKEADSAEAFLSEEAAKAPFDSEAEPKENGAAFPQTTFSKETDSRIRAALKSGRQDEFRSLLTDGGSRIPARNSSLLTYYDRTGKLVDLDPSNRYRILHSDKRSRKS